MAGRPDRRRLPADPGRRAVHAGRVRPGVRDAGRGHDGAGRPAGRAGRGRDAGGGAGRRPGGRDPAGAAPDDLDAIVELHARCSLTSRLRRYLAGTSCPPESTLARLLSPEAGHTLVAEDAGRADRGDGQSDVDRRPAPSWRCWCEDDWQGRRLGTALARRLVGLAERSGVADGHGRRARRQYARWCGSWRALVHRLHREYDARPAHADRDAAPRGSHPAVAEQHVAGPVCPAGSTCRCRAGSTTRSTPRPAR